MTDSLCKHCGRSNHGSEDQTCRGCGAPVQFFRQKEEALKEKRVFFSRPPAPPMTSTVQM